MPPPPVAPPAEGWWTRERALVLVLAAATAVSIYLCYRLVLPFLPAVAWALALAVVARPLHRGIAARVRKPGVAAVLSLCVISIALIAPMLFLVHSLVSQVAQGVALIEDGVQSQGWRAALEDAPRVEALLRWLEEHVDVEGEARRAAAVFMPDIAALMRGSIAAMLQLLVTLFILYYFLRDESKVLRFVRSLLPLSRAEADAMFSQIADSVHATVYGTLFVAALQGALGGLMFWWLGLPAPLLWGVVMGLLAVIPWLGAFVVWAPAAASLMLQGSWVKGLTLVAWGLFVIGLIDNLLYPILVGNRLRMHTLPVFMAILGGLVVFGGAGVVIGPVILAITAALLRVWQDRTRWGRTAEDNDV